jgi:hypothetical protein
VVDNYSYHAGVNDVMNIKINIKIININIYSKHLIINRHKKSYDFHSS